MGAYRSTPTLVGLILVVVSLPFASIASAASPDVVISQVYGGGGNLSAQYQSDFVELFNRGSSAVNLDGWSVQYATTTGAEWQKTDLGADTLQPGQYYLVQGASGTGCSLLPCGAPLPAVDVAGTMAMNSSGKLALVSGTTLFPSGTTCPVGEAVVRDFVGWGSTACFEGANATAGSNFASVVRFDRCADTDNNLNDFEQQSPSPRNSATTFAPCGEPPPIPSLSVDDVTGQEGDAGGSTFRFTVSLSSAAVAGGVTFDVATEDGSATAPDDYEARSLTRQTIAAGSLSYVFDVVVSGDAEFEDDERFFVQVTNLTGATVGDGTGRGTVLNDDEATAGPVVTSLTGPSDAVRVGATGQYSASFTDANSTDTHTVSWDWGDGSQVNDAATSPASASHAYLHPGFYTVRFTVTDSSDLSDADTLRVVVYDPDAGHVTGGGTFSEDASFSVMVAYKQSGETLAGSMNLTAPGVTFSATEFSWLVTSGASATFKGSGTFNGDDGYTFLMAVHDGGSPGSKDRVRLRIKDSAGVVVYDTQPGDPFDATLATQPTGGNLTVHKDDTATSNRRR